MRCRWCPSWHNVSRSSRSARLCFCWCAKVCHFWNFLSTVKMNQRLICIFDMFQIWYKKLHFESLKKLKNPSVKAQMVKGLAFSICQGTCHGAGWNLENRCCRGKFCSSPPIWDAIKPSQRESTSSREWTDTGSQVNNVNMVKWIINYCND